MHPAAACFPRVLPFLERVAEWRHRSVEPGYFSTVHSGAVDLVEDTMRKRSTLSPDKAAFAPPSDQATYSDLLLFENRLKGNALSLNRRKSRYQCAFPFDVRLFSICRQISLTYHLVFLAHLVLVICFLLAEVLLQTSFLIIPYKLILCYAFPEVYPSTADVDVQLHPYFASVLLFVAVTTLVLFFATGVYSEKIGYANRCVLMPVSPT